MRKVVLGLGISLDGYIARPDGAVDFLFMPKDYSMGPFFATIDTAIMGRKTYDDALKMGGGFGDSKMKSYVFSRSQPSGERGGVTFVNEPPKTFVENLRKRPGKNIWLMGGGELAQSLLAADLVDEIRLNIHPIVLGSGIPTFRDPGHRVKLALTECCQIDGGCILASYKVLQSK